MTTKEHHYFASNAIGWKVAATRDEAVIGLVEGFRSEFKGMVARVHKNGDPGSYVWSCKVETPIKEDYKINFFAPVGVPKTEPRDHYVTYVTNKKIAYYTPEVK